MLLKRLAVVALTTLTLACGEDRPRLRVVTQGSSFVRQSVPSTSVSPVAYVPYTVTNYGDRTAFLPTCGSRVVPVVEQLANGHWESYAAGLCMLTNSSVMIPLELGAGQKHQDEVAVGAAGRFRIRMPYTSDAQGSKHFDAVSRQFDVQ